MKTAHLFDIEIGSRVRLVNAFPYPSGLTGTVVAKVDWYESKFPWHVELDEGGGKTCLNDSECEVIAIAEEAA